MEFNDSTKAALNNQFPKTKLLLKKLIYLNDKHKDSQRGFVLGGVREYVQVGRGYGLVYVEKEVSGR
uniref:WGS project CBMG000000000 data, contig CS5907-c000366 n=1 Tax=Fusarium acuminatum CS5907 TaxID=1318461 RepID=A0A096PE31_9HYPO|nr:unnamed protein product [Fusarium acuminatum CS5907]